MNAGANDFRVLAGSQLINGGIDVNILWDADNKVRPVGAPDIGAYEFGSTVTSPSMSKC